MLVGEDISLAKAKKQNNSIEKGVSDVQSKLKFMNEMTKAQDQILKIIDKKERRKLILKGNNNKAVNEEIINISNNLNKYGL